MRLPSAGVVLHENQTEAGRIANLLRAKGLYITKVFGSGAAGWQHLQSNECDLLIMGWQLPELSGITLYNRVRRTPRLRTLPVVVVSTLLQDADFRLLDEFPCTQLLNQTPTRENLWQAARLCLDEERWYRKNAILIDNLVDFSEGNATRAYQMLRDAIKTTPNPAPLGVMVAKRLRSLNFMKEAESILKYILNQQQSCLPAINELGKVYYQTGRFKEAETLLLGAQQISPLNLSRLCLLGEMDLSQVNPETAKKHFSKALEIDPTDSAVQVGMTLAENYARYFPPQPTPDAITHGFASMLNTKGITLVRRGKYDDGIAKYQAALNYLFEKGAVARVTFNIGLAFLRLGKPGEAHRFFREALEISDGQFTKAHVYMMQADAGAAPEVTLQDAEEEFVPSGKPGFAPAVSAPALDDDDLLEEESLLPRGVGQRAAS